MAKKMVYVVNGLEKVSSIREVCEILGEKVTKKQVADGEVEAVEYLEEDEADELLAEDDTEDDTEDDSDVINSIPEEDDVETDSTDDEGDIDDSDDPVDSDVEPVEHSDDNEEDYTPDGLDNEPEDDNEIEERRRAESGADIKPDAKQDKHKVPPTLAEKLAKITKPKEEKSTASTKLDPNTPVDYPEVGEFKSDKDLKKFIKKLTDTHLEEWCDLYSLEYKPCDNAGINRMRMAMAIKELHFPNPNKGSGKKSKSKYADLTTEMLVDMCAENDIQLKDSKGDMRILRMYAIMALRNEGFLE